MGSRFLKVEKQLERLDVSAAGSNEELQGSQENEAKVEMTSKPEENLKGIDLGGCVEGKDLQITNPNMADSGTSLKTPVSGDPLLHWLLKRNLMLILCVGRAVSRKSHRESRKEARKAKKREFRALQRLKRYRERDQRLADQPQELEQPKESQVGVNTQHPTSNILADIHQAQESGRRVETNIKSSKRYKKTIKGREEHKEVPQPKEELEKEPLQRQNKRKRSGWSRGKGLQGNAGNTED